MSTFWAWIIGQFQTNQMLTGLIGGSVAAGLLYLVRAVPGQIWLLLKEQFSVNIELHSDDIIFSHTTVLFGRAKFADRTRRLQMAEAYDYEKEKWDWEYTLGDGFHAVRHAGTWFFVHRSTKDAGGMKETLTGRRQSTITITTLGRSQTAIRGLIDQAKKIYDSDSAIKVYFWADGSFILADRKRIRPLSSVFLPQEQKDRIVKDINDFSLAHNEYLQRGTPYRRGYLFEGPPGSGKTTMIFVLAGITQRDVYIINLNSVNNDVGFQSAMNAVGDRGIAVIEDIDGSKVTHDRERIAEREEKSGKTEAATKLTLSGILNGIDGIAAREGRILCITSNRTGDLDPALIRPGRVDVREYIDKLQEPEARAMFAAFYPKADSAWFDTNVLTSLPMAASELQNLLIKGADHVRDSIAN